MENVKKKLAVQVSGLENGAKHFNVNDNAAESLLKAEVIAKHEDNQEQYINRYDAYVAALEKEKSLFLNRPEDLEIAAIGNNLIVVPYKENPFQQVRRNSQGLYIDCGGLAPEYKSQEDGHMHEEQSGIRVAKVYSAGPDCKYVQKDDIVMYTVPSETPIPFYRQHMCTVSEQRIMCVINKGLTERFNK